jgi:hypothetical protein
VPSCIDWKNPRAVYYFFTLNLVFYLLVIGRSTSPQCLTSGRHSFLSLSCYLFICLSILSLLYSSVATLLGPAKDKEDVRYDFDCNVTKERVPFMKPLRTSKFQKKISIVTSTFV